MPPSESSPTAWRVPGFRLSATAGDDRRDRLIPDDGGMDLAKVHGYYVLAGRRLGLLAVLHDDVPEVPPRLLVVDQADFQEPQGIPQGHRDRQGDLPLLPFLLRTASTGQFQDIAVPLDTRSTNDHNLRSLRKFWNPFSHAALSSCSVSACRAASNAVTLLKANTTASGRETRRASSDPACN